MNVTLHPIRDVPEMAPGDDLGLLLVEALRRSRLWLEPADVMVVTHKVVSKAEGALVRLSDDGTDAHRQVVEDEAVRILRRRGPLTIAETRHGFVCANAGVDRSNVAAATAVLQPRDPDASARRLRARLSALTGVEPAVIISDTFGRPWRRGLTDVAIGLAGMEAILDLRGTADHMGRPLEVTEVAVADELAAAADLVMGKASRIPAVVIRGVAVPAGDGRATDLVRPIHEDMFR